MSLIVARDPQGNEERVTPLLKQLTLMVQEQEAHVKQIHAANLLTEWLTTAIFLTHDGLLSVGNPILFGRK